MACSASCFLSVKGEGIPSSSSSCSSAWPITSRCSLGSLGSLGMRKRRSTVEAVLMTNPRSSLPCIRSNSFLAPQRQEVFDYKKKMMDQEKEAEKRRRTDPVTADKMDVWMSESIGEIVRNIGEAPFLVQIFSNSKDDGKTKVLRLEREPAFPERWPETKKKWNEGNGSPDGVILVEELKDEEDQEEVENDDVDRRSKGSSSGTEKKWGVVVQGRGMDCAAACYVLNTCRVKSTAGFCTHFCLVRAKCFGEPLEVQLTKAWLP